MQVNERKSTISSSNLDDEDHDAIVAYLPFQIREAKEGLKYLGFHLKAIDYRKNEWDSLIAKIEKCLKV